MRALFFILVLLNLLFYGWAHWIDVPAQRVRPDGALPALRLAQQPAGAIAAEVATSAKSGTGAAAGAAASNSSAPAARCLSLGPYANAEAATRASEVLTARGFSARPRGAEPVTRTEGYWVYVPALKSAAARNRALARLTRAGIHEAEIMSEPEYIDRVSAGVFADEDRAQRRLQQVRGLGLSAQVEPRLRTVLEFWVDVPLPAGASAPAPTESAWGNGTATLITANCVVARP